MTKKTEMVSVPRELLESALAVVARHCTSNWSARIKDGLEEAFAAPAEDVRAVGEEPVYQVCNGVSGWIDVDLLRYTACQLDPEEYETRMLFVRPQRPLVLPERYDESQYRGTSLLAVRRWNACIDEFGRLNKC